MKLLSFSLALLLSVPAFGQQSVRFRGKVEDVSGTFNQFVLDCTDVRLTSATVALLPLVGQQGEIQGTYNGNALNPSVEVTSFTPLAEDFEIGGGGKIGDVAKFEVRGAPGDSALIFGGPGSGFVPLPVAGAVLVDPFQVELIGIAPIPATGLLQFDSPIPNDPALVGVTYHGQALLTLSGGGFRLTMNDCKTLSN